MEPIKYRVLTPCDHNSLCLSCYMRNTICYHHENCYYCQNPLKGYPIVSTNPKLTKYSEAKATHPVFDSQYKLFFTDKDNIRNYIASLFHFTCPECSLRLPAFDMFAAHVKIHKMRVCQICFASNRFLPGDTHVFHSNKEYQNHIKTQHPRCMLCSNQIFFDHDELTKHMLENHHRCEVCAAMNKIAWFKDAASLVEHHEKCHFLCPHCSSQHPVSFSTKGELLIHLKSVHGQKSQPIDISDFTASPNSNNKDENDDIESNNREVVERRRELNRKFMTRLNELLNEKDKAELMKIARDYVANKVTGDFFYNEYARFLGREKDALFNEMVSFLPIPEKRLELIRIHTTYNSTHQLPPQPQQQPPEQREVIHQNQQQNFERRNKNQKPYNKNQRRGYKQNQNNQNRNQHQNVQNNRKQVQNQAIQIPVKSNQNQIQNNTLQNNQVQDRQEQTPNQNNQNQTEQNKQNLIASKTPNQQPKQQITVLKKDQQQPKTQITISINRSKPASISFEKAKPKEEAIKMPPPAALQTES